MERVKLLVETLNGGMRRPLKAGDVIVSEDETPVVFDQEAGTLRALERDGR